MVCDEASSLKRLCSQIVNEEIVLEDEEKEETEPVVLSMLNLNSNLIGESDEDNERATSIPQFQSLPDATSLNEDITCCIQDTESMVFDNVLKFVKPVQSDIDIQIQFDNDSDSNKMDKMIINIGIKDFFYYPSS